jgi:hypothetical protein
MPPSVEQHVLPVQLWPEYESHWGCRHCVVLDCPSAAHSPLTQVSADASYQPLLHDRNALDELPPSLEQQMSVVQLWQRYQSHRGCRHCAVLFTVSQTPLGHVYGVGLNCSPMHHKNALFQSPSVEQQVLSVQLWPTEEAHQVYGSEAASRAANTASASVISCIPIVLTGRGERTWT